jgi:putative serine protease PepD
VLALAVISGVIGAALVTGVLYATGAAGQRTEIGRVSTVSPPQPRNVSDRSSSSKGSTASDTAAIYAAAAPGVVAVTSSGVHTPSGTTATATGTGFEIDSQGTILTAGHVVAGASQISVRLADGSTHSAKVVGADTSIDTAVLNIDPSGRTLHPLPLGSSQALAVGDPLAVIGDPFGLANSLSTGVVSALHRAIQAPNGFAIADGIQTDAAIDPGNSGGPVLNEHGQVVGITDQIATNGSDSFSGVGFAVPIDAVRGELPKIEQGIQVSHAFLGVSLVPAGSADGALIAAIAPNTPAARAGLRQGDLVTAVNGRPIRGPAGLLAGIAAEPPGSRLTLTVQRDSQRLTVTVTLSAQPTHP